MHIIKGSVHIRKSNPNYHSWLKQRMLKKFRYELQRKVKREQQRYCNRNISKKKESNNKRTIDKVYTVPNQFSIIENPSKIIDFFNQIKNYIKRNKDRKNCILGFDLSGINRITIDAIMYLIAIMKNLQKSNNTKYDFCGNIPVNEDVRAFFKETGFFKFVHSRNMDIEQRTNLLSIMSGVGHDTVITQKICDFIRDRTGCTIVHTKYLFALLGELVENARTHAYFNTNSNKLANNWYVFVEGDIIDKYKYKFTFLDTGHGIPYTVYRKNLIEKNFITDSDLVLSALDGKFKTRTQESNRGNGLPFIKNGVKDGSIDNLHIITNKAYCILKDKCEHINKEALKDSLNGTIYYWEIDFREVGEKE